MKTIFLVFLPGESREDFIHRCREAVASYYRPVGGGPRPFIVDNRQAGGCYHGQPHKRLTVLGLAGHQPAVSGEVVAGGRKQESGAWYSPTAEAVALAGVVL